LLKENLNRVFWHPYQKALFLTHAHGPAFSRDSSGALQDVLRGFKGDVGPKSFNLAVGHEEDNMQEVSRRNFLKYCIGSAAALGLNLTVLGKLEQALAAGGNAPPIIWLNGANCTGCTVSLANLIGSSAPSDVADLLINTIDLAFHPNLMGAAGDEAVENLNTAIAGGPGSYVLAIDGGIPTAFGGHTCVLWTDGGQEVTAQEAVLSLAPNALAVLAIGTCASFGGIPSADPNPTGIVSVRDMAGSKTINIPGCPTHPDWIVWTIANLLAGTNIELDDDQRPKDLFHKDLMKIHKNCPRKGREKADIFGVQDECLKELGCKGPDTVADCFSRQWNNGTNWCIGANSICLGCTEKGFPDEFSPFYKIEYGYEDYSGNENVLQITLAEWKKEKSELKVEGKGAKGAKVKISDADTGSLLGTVSVKSDEKWKFKIKKKSSIPSRIQAESNGNKVEAKVKKK